jgi:predicted metal-dependent peptidase
MKQLTEKNSLEEVKKKTLAFTSKMKTLMVVLGKMDFYTFFYFTFAEEFDPKVPVMAMRYTDTISYALPRIVYGPELIPFIEKILEKTPDIADGFVKEVEKEEVKVQAISKENKELLKRLFIFREIVKHEIIHYINLHLPRTIEFFKRRGINKISEPLLIIANVAADSICNIYLDMKVIEQGELVPPLEKEIPLEELLEKLVPKKNKCCGIGVVINDSEDIDKGTTKGFKDFLSEEAEELEKHDFSRIKEIVGGILEKAIKEYKMYPKSIGTIPGEIEETIKWLKKRRVKFRLAGEDNLFGLFREVERTYFAYNPLNANNNGFVFPAYRPLGGRAIVIIVDTSASMRTEELQYSLDLINNLVKQAEIYLVEIDAMIQRVRKVEHVEEEFNFKGRGGTIFTDLERLPQFLSERNITACIILTDGYVKAFPEKKPLPRAKWIGITTCVIPKNSPDWITWFKVERVIEDSGE